MATRAQPTLTLAPETTGGGVWRLSIDGIEWRAEPNWPTEANLAAVRWQVEEASSTNLTRHTSEVRLLAAQLGAALWESLTAEAPSSARPALAAKPLHVVSDTVSPSQVAAISLLNRGNFGPHDQLSHLFVSHGASSPDHRDIPFRPLLITARPMGVNDAPYMGVAQPLAVALSAIGCPLLRAYPPRKSELERIVRAADASGTPFTAIIFDGHGFTTREGRCFIALESGLGRPAVFDAKAFSALLGSRPAPLIILAACRTAHSDVESDLSTSFAADLARRTGSDVVAMTYSVAPRHAMLVATGIIKAIADGRQIADGVSEARISLGEVDPTSLVWASPVHFSSSSVRFTVEHGCAVELPRSIPRQLECREADRALDKARLLAIYGTPLAGKTEFLSQYAWWFGTQAAKNANVFRFDARSFNRPLDVANLVASEVSDHDLVIIDAAEHWSSAAESDWTNFLSVVAGSDFPKCRWIAASRSGFALPEGDRRVSRMLLSGIGGGGLRSVAERVDLEAALFDPVVHEDLWLPLLLTATRGEPILLKWSARHLNAGTSSRDLLWTLVFPDPSVASELENLGADPAELVGIDPMLGWGFGADVRHLLAWLEYPEDESETEEFAERAEYHGGKFEALGRHGLALQMGGRWNMSPTHATLLRARRPIGDWSRLERERYADYYSFFVNLQIGSTNPEAVQHVRAMFKNSQSVLDIFETGLSVERLLWGTVMLSLPNAVAAAELAVETDQAKTLGAIAAGISRAALEFDLDKSSISWLEWWAARMTVLEGRGIDVSLGQKYLVEEFERLEFASGSRSVQDASHRRLSVAASAISPDLADGIGPGEIIRRTARAFASGGAEFVPHHFDNFVSAIQLMVGGAGSREIHPTDIIELIHAVQEKGARSGVLQLTLMAGHLFMLLGDLVSAEDHARRAVVLAEADATYEQFIVNAAAAELLGLTGGEGQIAAAQRAVHFAKKLGDELSIGIAQLQLASALSVEGDLIQAQHQCAEAIPKLRTLTLYRHAALLTYAKILSAQGELDLAETYRAEVEANAANANPTIYLEALGLALILLLQAGRFDESAEETARHVLEAAQNVGSPQVQGIACWYLAEMYAEREDFSETLSYATSAVELLRKNDREGYLPRVNALLAQGAYQLDLHALACEAQLRAATGFEAHYLDPVEMAFSWAVLEVYALVAEDQALAARAAQKVAALSGSAEHYTTGQAAMTALGWEHFGELDTAVARAKLALRDRDALNSFFIEQLEQIAAIEL